MKILNFSTMNSRNIPYLCTRYLPRLLDGCVCRSYQILQSPYGFPSDMIQQDPNMRMRDAIKNQLLQNFDVNIFHGDFNSLPNIYKLKDDLTGTIIPYFYDYSDTISCKNNNSHIITDAPIIFVRQPQLAAILDEWKDKVIYIPSPCSVDRKETCLTSGQTEYVFPDDWIIIGHFGESNEYYGLVGNASNFYDAKVLAYHEIRNMSRHLVISSIERMDLHIDSHTSDFYSQSAIETGMAGVPTIVNVNSSLKGYVDGSPFILADRSRFQSQLLDVIRNLDEHKQSFAQHNFFDRHQPHKSMMVLITELKSKQVI